MPSPFRTELPIPLGLGLLKLSTEGRPAEEDAIALIHRALDAGVRLLDTGDSYCLDDKDMHYGEHLARKAVDSWSGPADEVTIATKVGLTRPKGRWVPNGSPAHIRKAIEGSAEALGRPIPLLLLHANDPKTPLDDTLQALAKAQKDGLVEHLGLCNTSVAQVRQAERLFPVMAIQNELSVQDRNAGKDGLVALAAQLEIPFLAHRPFGGHAKAEKLEKNRAMKPLAKKHEDFTPWECALASLLAQDPGIVALVGPTQPKNLDSCIRALELKLDEDDLAHVDEKITFKPTDETLRTIEPPLPAKKQPTFKKGATSPGAAPEVVIVMGVQGAGKSTTVDAYVEAGYERLNRDILGGKLEDLIPMIDERLADGRSRIVLDNTYPSKAQRFPVIQTAHRHGVPVRCQHLATPLKEARINVVHRILDRYGRLLGPDDFKELAKDDPNLPPPMAMNAYAAQFEPPSKDEGFAAIEEIPFEREDTPDRSGPNKALLLDVDGTLRITKSGEIYPRDPGDIELLPNRREVLQRWIDDGYTLFFISNQSGIASNNVSQDAVDACFARTRELLDLPVAETIYCPHKAFPANCFCRKPQPGMGIYLMREHKLDPAAWHMVGDMASDEAFAEAIGATYHHADDFFAG